MSKTSYETYKEIVKVLQQAESNDIVLGAITILVARLIHVYTKAGVPRETATADFIAMVNNTLDNMQNDEQ